MIVSLLPQGESVREGGGRRGGGLAVWGRISVASKADPFFMSSRGDVESDTCFRGRWIFFPTDGPSLSCGGGGVKVTTGCR